MRYAIKFGNPNKVPREERNVPRGSLHRVSARQKYRPTPPVNISSTPSMSEKSRIVFPFMFRFPLFVTCPCIFPNTSASKFDKLTNAFISMITKKYLRSSLTQLDSSYTADSARCGYPSGSSPIAS